jgi:hypothetical protein
MKPSHLFLAACVSLISSGTHPLFSEELNYAFRSARWDEKLFRATGPDTLRALQLDTGGLRITLGKDRTSKVPVGLCTRFGLGGDFEITMTYEILRIEKPASGSGAGVSVYVSTVSSNQDAAGVARLVKSKGENVFTAFKATTPEGQKRKYRHSDPLQSQTLYGKLRLVRRGTELTFFVAEMAIPEFQQLYKTDWSADDVEIIRFAAENGGSPGLVNIRIKELRIRADQFGATKAPPPSTPVRGYWWLIALFVLSATAVGVRWWRYS